MLRDRARGFAHLHRHGAGVLRHVDDFVIEQHLGIRKKLQAIQDKLCSLELFALHDKWMPRVVFEDGVIELRDQLLARPVPELKDRSSEPDARHVADQRVVQEVERCRVGRRGARIDLQRAVVVEQPQRQPVTPDEPGAEQADRPPPAIRILRLSSVMRAH